MAHPQSSDTRTSYAETSVFTRVMGTTARVKIIDVFLGKYYRQLTAAEVAELAGVHESTFNRTVPELIDIGLVEKTGKIGNSIQYQLNTESRIAQILQDARWELAKESDEVSRDIGKNTFFSHQRSASKEELLNRTAEQRRVSDDENAPRLEDIEDQEEDKEHRLAGGTAD